MPRQLRCAAHVMGWQGRVTAGGLDQLSDDEDLRTLTSSLLSNVSIYTHVEPHYQHLDFTCKSPLKKVSFRTAQTHVTKCGYQVLRGLWERRFAHHSHITLPPPQQGGGILTRPPCSTYTQDHSGVIPSGCALLHWFSIVCPFLSFKKQNNANV